MAMSNRNNLGTQETNDDSFNDIHVNDLLLAEDQIFISHPSRSSLDAALHTYIPPVVPSIIEQQQRAENTDENVSPLNTLSRVAIATAKYPNDTTLYNYGDLQTWMYTHTNKRAPVEVCEFLSRMIYQNTDRYDNGTLFNLHLICAEVYQTIGDLDQAHCQYDNAELIANILNNSTSILTHHDLMEKNRKQKKLDDIGMKIEFQEGFKCNLMKGRKRPRSVPTSNDFFNRLSDQNLSPEDCPVIWRNIALEVALNLNIAIRGAEWLLSYADRLQPSTLQHANSLYVSLNLFLLAYGSYIFQPHLHIDVFKMLDNISRYFEANGNQSKQFSPVHKMAHVWGLAAVAYHLASDQYRYLVCASMIRVSFESLNICFMSSGIETLYILARARAPEFFTMMATVPSIKLTSPDCINYFRRQLDRNDTCIPYSTETVNQFVSDIFNLDQTAYRV